MNLESSKLLNNCQYFLNHVLFLKNLFYNKSNLKLVLIQDIFFLVIIIYIHVNRLFSFIVYTLEYLCNHYNLNELWI